MITLDLKRILEGVSGYEASNIIYINDKTLKEGISELRSIMDASEKINIPTIINVEGQSEIELAQDLGGNTPSTIKVVSQKGISDVITDIKEGLDNVAYIADISIEGDAQVTHVIVADRAIEAATDSEGHSLVAIYNDVEDLKNSPMVLHGPYLYEVPDFPIPTPNP
jgi:hypothetical protein